MNQPNCAFGDVCTLWQTVHSPYISLSGNRKNPQIIFVGEVPGEEEDLENTNFTGRAGEKLRNICDAVGFDMAVVGITNTVKCRTWEEYKGRRRNRTPKESEAKLCKIHAVTEINILKPKIVVLLGNTPLKNVLGTAKKNITAVRGQVFEVDGIKYVPTFHPASIFRQPENEEWILKDMAFVWELYTGEHKIVVRPQYILVDSKSRILELLHAAEEATECATDTETTRLSPYAKESSKLVCASFSFQERSGWVVPYMHSHMPLSPKELAMAKAVCKEIWESPMPKAFQNGKFDISWLHEAEGVVVENLAFDTMLAQYMVSEVRSTHSLDYMSWQHTDMEDYYAELHAYKTAHKEADPERGGSYANVPWPILVPYSGGDSDCTLRVSHVLRKILVDYPVLPSMGDMSAY